MTPILLPATIFLVAAVIMVPLAKRLGLGSVLGYLLAGVIIGPIFGLVGSETQEIQHIAEFGVVMMLFIVGLELEPKALWGMRSKLLGLGGLQIGLTTVAICVGGMALGLEWSVALAVGLAFSLSSTAIVVQTLNEKSLMPTQGGRSAFSVLLAQDIAVIPMLALLPLLVLPGLHNEDTGHGDGHGGDHGAGHGDGHGAAMSLVEGLPGWGVTLITIAAIAVVILAGIYLTRPIFQYVGKARLREMYTALALAMVIGVAFLMTLVGLSPALGTFLVGVVLANSEYRHELESDIDPFKGLLLGLFFITVGAGINFDLLFGQFGTVIGLTLGVMLVKGAILYGLAVMFNLGGRDKLLFALCLAQAGEFGFVMLSTTVQNNVIPRDLSELLSLIVALSMLLTPLLFILYDQLAARMTDEDDAREHDEITEEGTVMIVGIGRFGQIVNRLAIASRIKTVVIDHHIEQIERLRHFGVKGYFGDPSRPDLMHAAGLMSAKILVVALDDKDAATQLVKYARSERPDLHIIARAYDREHVYRLFAAGANDIVRETFDSAVRASKYMLHEMGWDTYETDMAADSFVDADRSALRELAQLWDEDIPATENAPYVERAKAINEDFQTSFLDNLAFLNEKDKGDKEA